MTAFGKHQKAIVIILLMIILLLGGIYLYLSRQPAQPQFMYTIY